MHFVFLFPYIYCHFVSVLLVPLAEKVIIHVVLIGPDRFLCSTRRLVCLQLCVARRLAVLFRHGPMI